MPDPPLTTSMVEFARSVEFECVRVLVGLEDEARAGLKGLEDVTPDHIKEVFLPVVRHRVALDSAEELEGLRADLVLERSLVSVEVPR